MLKSCMSNKPNTDQRKQFTTDAMVNGNGIDLALLVSNTCFTAARGLANMAALNTTPKAPIMAAAVSVEN